MDRKQAAEDRPDPRGQTTPIDGRDRSHEPRPEGGQAPAGGGRTSGAEQEPHASEEAKNQAATSGKTRAESGTP